MYSFGNIFVLQIFDHMHIESVTVSCYNICKFISKIYIHIYLLSVRCFSRSFSFYLFRRRGNYLVVVSSNYWLIWLRSECEWCKVASFKQINHKTFRTKIVWSSHTFAHYIYIWIDKPRSQIEKDVSKRKTEEKWN